MSREEIEKLLGGYATDTLSEAERRALFEAALDDRELFAELAKEQALRELLQDPPARQQLLEALSPAREPLGARAWRWLRRPAVLAMAGGLAALLIVAGLLLRSRQAARKEEVVVVADEISQPQAPTAVTPRAKKPAPAGAAVETKRKLKRPLPRSLQSPESQPLNSRNQLPPSAFPLVQPAPPPPAASRPGGFGMPANGAVGALVSPQMAKARAPAPNPSVKYTLLLMGADGAYSPAPPDAVFHTGDSAAIQVEPNEAGFLYLFQKDAGVWNSIAGVPAEKGQRYVLPSGGIQSASPGNLDLMLVFSRREQADFQTADVDSLVANAGQGVYRIAVEFR
jgi:hypothetical protein